MQLFLDGPQMAKLTAVCDVLIPEDAGPGAVAMGAPEYIDELLGAFKTSPPRVWAGGPYSGRHGGTNSYLLFEGLSRVEELAWRLRIEGSCGRAEREWNGPYIGLQERYTAGLSALGQDFVEADPTERIRRLEAGPDFLKLVYGHVCEGVYGAPEYGGNIGLAGWTYLEYEGDVQPRGYVADRVSVR